MLQGKVVFGDWHFEFAKAKGSHIWDVNGKRYLDFTSGWNVTNLGWNHPEVNAAVAKQAKENPYSPMWEPNPIIQDYADALASELPQELNTFSRCTGGTEANEQAIKLARAYTGKEKILAFTPSYNGESFTELSLGVPREFLKRLGKIPNEFVQMEFPSVFHSDKTEQEILEDFSIKLESILKEETFAAVITEAGMITGWGSALVAPKGYLSVLSRLTKKYGVVLILDEVGTGFGRCGEMFGMYLEKDFVPDIATFAKGISNGAAPLGAVAMKKKIAEDTMGDCFLISTFGWTPLSCAAGLETLKIHKREKTWEQSKSKGEILMKELKDRFKDNKLIGDVRGQGLEIGLQFVKAAETKISNPELASVVAEKCRSNGLDVIYGDDGVIQLMPALTISQEDLIKGCDLLKKSVDEVQGKGENAKLRAYVA